jgi:hypothetical protein
MQYCGSQPTNSFQGAESIYKAYNLLDDQEFPRLFRNLMFISVFTRVRYWVLSQTRWMQFILSHAWFQCYPSIFTYNFHWFTCMSSSLLRLHLRLKMYVNLLFLPCGLLALNVLINIWRTVQIVKHLIMQFSPSSFCFLSFFKFHLALQPQFGPWPTSMKHSVSLRFTRF